MPEIPVTGSKADQATFKEVYRHYQTAKEDLEVRIPDFDKKDTLFRSHIDEKNWPYRAIMFDPRTFTALFEKTSRLLANKPRGRMVPREGGDSLGAKICNELVSFQWDDNERLDSSPMLAKWAQMDMAARKYGASFALVKWQTKRQIKKEKDPLTGKIVARSVVYYDGPDFRPLNNRDVLANPSYSTIKHWFQHRDYVTFQELQDVNDTARTDAAKYKNLDVLYDMLKKESKENGGGDRRDVNYQNKNKSIKGLTDYLGTDEVFKTIELVTEYRETRWITFSPRYGVVIRDMENPYDHGQIPVVMLKYYPIDDDLYGLSEIEPVEKLQRAVNALVSQYMDAINMSLYNPLKIRQTGGAVQMHTLDFGPGAKWLMNDPTSDVIEHQSNPSGVTEFASTYRFLISAMQEALGETSQGISNLAPGSESKTATEIKDLALSRNARDNFNQLFLGEALKRQMLLWQMMNKQFLFANPAEQQKVIRIVGKDTIQFFQSHGLDGEGLSDEGIDALTFAADEGTMVDPSMLTQPLFPVNVDGQTMPKFNVDEGGQFGQLVLEPEDLSGVYDYIPDVGSMQLPDDNQKIAVKKQMVELALNPATTQLLMQEGFKLKVKEVLEDYFEQLGDKDADKYFEKLQQMDPLMQQQMLMGGGMPNGANSTGAGGAQAGAMGAQYGAGPGMAAGAQAVSNGQA